MTTVRSALAYLTGETKSLDMMISFDHMLADCIMTEYVHLPFSLLRFKHAISNWQNTLAGRSWNVLYLENHDHPRVISRYGSEQFRRESGTMLAVSYLFLQGTPFIYQGQEIGMTNIRLKRITDYMDLASRTNYERLFTFEPPSKRLKRVHDSSRDSARTPMQWNDGKYAGFSTHEPWFRINPNYRSVNVAREEASENSILNFYRKCLAIRKRSKTLLYGSYREFFPLHPRIFMYERVYRNIAYLIICSFSSHRQMVTLPDEYADKTLQLVLCNYPGRTGKSPEFAPYEARVYRTHQ
jgi:oligo-1,6-glucosidase